VLGAQTTAARPTLADVARAAGVSAATASRVLNGSARVRPDTRQQVEHAIARLGYVRNRAARSTALSPPASIALVICEENTRVFSEQYFSLLAGSISRELASGDAQLVLLTVHSPRDYHTVTRYLRSGRVDGALIASMHGRRPIRLHDLGIPVVLNGRPMADGDAVSYVDADNLGGAKLAVRHLLRSGRGVVGTVAGPQDMAVGADRLRGYRAAMADAGLSDAGLIVYGDFSRLSAEHAVDRLLNRRPGIGAVFAASDLMAAGVLRALRRTGRRVPDDVAVIGFDDLPFAAHAEPQLTTVRQPIAAMGGRMVRELLALVAQADRPQCRVVLGTELVIRKSA
jgi:DNA-binding LacI/PurR family transcriptional regulator